MDSRNFFCSPGSFSDLEACFINIQRINCYSCSKPMHLYLNVSKSQLIFSVEPGLVVEPRCLRKLVILVRFVHCYSVGAREFSMQLFSTTCGNRKVANSTYWGLAGGYILPKNSHCFTRTCKGCPKTYMTLCFQISNSFDISQYSFACVIKLNFDCFVPSKHNVSVFALYIHWTDPSLVGCRSLWQPWSTKTPPPAKKQQRR